jgi:putative Mg2+ transporter-C (MgtC) family protein
LNLFDINWSAELGILLTVAVAMVLGGAVGYERQLRGRPAGFRTHMLIAGSAALLLGMTDLIAEHFNQEIYASRVQIDPVRVIEAMITAIAFIGAGTIIQHARRDVVLGLTTAASLLFTVSIGIAVGLGHLVLATGVTVLAVLTLRVLTGPSPEESRHSQRGE